MQALKEQESLERDLSHVSFYFQRVMFDFCLCVCMRVRHVCADACTGQKRALKPLELELGHCESTRDV